MRIDIIKSDINFRPIYVNPRSRCEARMFKVAHMFGPRSDWDEDRISEVKRLVYGPLYLSLREVAFRLI